MVLGTLHLVEPQHRIHSISGYLRTTRDPRTCPEARRNQTAYYHPVLFPFANIFFEFISKIFQFVLFILSTRWQITNSPKFRPRLVRQPIRKRVRLCIFSYCHTTCQQKSIKWLRKVFKKYSRSIAPLNINQSGSSILENPPDQDHHVFSSANMSEWKRTIIYLFQIANGKCSQISPK